MTTLHFLAALLGLGIAIAATSWLERLIADGRKDHLVQPNHEN